MVHLDCNKGRRWPDPQIQLDRLRLQEEKRRTPTPEAALAAEGKTREMVLAENKSLRKILDQLSTERHEQYLRESQERTPRYLTEFNKYLEVQLKTTLSWAKLEILVGLEPVDKLRWLLGRHPRRYIAPLGAACERCGQLSRGTENRLKCTVPFSGISNAHNGRTRFSR